MGLISRITEIFGKKNKQKEYMAVRKDSGEIYVSKNLKENKDYLKEFFKDSEDIVYREISVGSSFTPLLMVYIKSLVDKNTLNDHILKPLLDRGNYNAREEKLSASMIKERVLAVSEVKESKDFAVLANSILSGDTLLFLHGSDYGLIAATGGGKFRSVSESSAERILRGPQDAFVERMDNNITLIRSRIRHPKLAVEMLNMGENTKTGVALVYIKGLVKNGVAEKIKEKLQNVKTHGIISSAQIEQLIEKHKWSIFPQVMATDRPDKLASSILEGRVVMIVDGTPFALIAPVTFAMFLNSTDDYFERAITTSIMRIIRYICYFIATTLPALYLALTTFHVGMLPTPLVLYITGTRIGLPFPSFVEILFITFTLEILVEASVRLPKAIGQTVGIVGGLVIGQAIVQAGLVSPVVVIIVALTAISTFVLPVYTFTLSNRALRLVMIMGAAVFGLYGIVMVWILLIVHLASLESFGVRYLADFSPYKLKKLTDTFIKVPEPYLNDIPDYLQNKSDKQQ